MMISQMQQTFLSQVTTLNKKMEEMEERITSKVQANAAAEANSSVTEDKDGNRQDKETKGSSSAPPTDALMNNDDNLWLLQGAAGRKKRVYSPPNASIPISQPTKGHVEPRRPCVALNYATRKSFLKQHTPEGKTLQFNTAELHEIAHAFKSEICAPVGLQVTVVSVIQDAAKALSDNDFKYAGTILLSPEGLRDWGTIAPPTNWKEQLAHLEDILQTALITKAYETVSGMKDHIKAITFTLRPVNTPEWNVLGILVGVPAASMLHPGDAIAARIISEQVWRSLMAGREDSPDAAVLSKYDTAAKRATVFGLTVYNTHTTVGESKQDDKKTHNSPRSNKGTPPRKAAKKRSVKLVGLCFARSLEGNLVAKALFQLGFSQVVEKPKMFDIGGGIPACVLPFPKFGDNDFQVFIGNCAREMAKNEMRYYYHRITAVSTALAESEDMANEIVCNTDYIIGVLPDTKYGRAHPGAIIVCDSMMMEVTTMTTDILAETIFTAIPASKPSESLRMATMQIHHRHQSLKTAQTSSTIAIAKKKAHSPTTSTEATVTDVFISARSRSAMAKSIKFAPRVMTSKNIYTVCFNAAGGSRLLGVFLWEEVKHLITGVRYTEFKNVATAEEGYALLSKHCPECGIVDAASQRAYHMTVPITETNLSNPYHPVPESKAKWLVGVMYFEDDDAAMLLSRQQHTAGHIEAKRVATGTTTFVIDETTATTLEGDVEDDENSFSHSQPIGTVDLTEAATVEDSPPKKRRLEEETTLVLEEVTTAASDVSALATLSPRASKNDSHIMLFTVPIFTLDIELKDYLCKELIEEPDSTIGLVMNVHQDANAVEPDGSNAYIAVTFYNEDIGRVVLNSLQGVRFCGIELNPRWLRFSEWQCNFRAYKKLSDHGRIREFATHPDIIAIKRTCPLHLHKDLDTLLKVESNIDTIKDTVAQFFSVPSAPTANEQTR